MSPGKTGKRDRGSPAFDKHLNRPFDTLRQGFDSIELYRGVSIASQVRMRMSSRASAMVLTATVLSAVFLQACLLQPVRAQSSSIDLSQEYSSGDVEVFPYLQAWYTWVNVNGTHTIFLALHSNQLPSPVSSFVGQAYNTSSGSRVFVANALLAMEVYDDTNGNGFLDANYAAGNTELRYTLIMNASQTFTPYPVNKTIIDGTPHYRWGITYGNIQAILINATSPEYGYGGGMAASYTTIDDVSLFYDYSISGNTTYLKTSYEIGTVTLVPPTNPGVTLQGLSFSLLHATLTISSGQLAVVAGSAPYDSQTNTTPSLVNAAQVTVDNVLAFEFRFRDNYTLLQNPPSSYPALYLASPSDSIPLDAFEGQSASSLIRVQDYVRASLPDIAGLPASSDFNYNSSKFLYRVSYPTWSGYALQHDPTYVAYLGPGLGPGSPPASPPGLPIATLTIAIFTGFLALVVAVNGLRSARKPAQLTDESQGPGSSGNNET